ncbi:hypothetical protein Btru_017546 [Bulinus truncatus]|nr:hypothetical protein Btru_017546 [Bulinus truncatus]
MALNAGELVCLGTHEAEASYSGEADLSKNFMNCSKNPQHDTFVPADGFEKCHLPESYREDDIFDLTRTLVELTVRVTTRFTSPERPEYYPDTSVRYPFYDYIGEKRLTRTGTGRIWDVRKLTEEDDVECPCSVCQLSTHPVKRWGHINVITATHVIFNVEEAKHATCRLDYNTDNGPYTEVQGWGRDGSDILEDRYLLTCVTHDETVLDRLRKQVDHYNDISFKVYKKYFPAPKMKTGWIIQFSTPARGCGKSGSHLREWKDRYLVGRAEKPSNSYTAATCPGSSDALTYMLGRSRLTLDVLLSFTVRLVLMSISADCGAGNVKIRTTSAGKTKTENSTTH